MVIAACNNNTKLVQTNRKNKQKNKENGKIKSELEQFVELF